MTNRRESSAERARRLQQEYYARTAAAYEEQHVCESDEQFEALEHILFWVSRLGLRSLLDVGAGTGRAQRFFRQRMPGLPVFGLEPVRDLIDQSDRAPDAIPTVLGTGEALPFATDSVDAVCEFATLHHVPDAQRVVEEMKRVARRAIFLSDDNRFGHGAMAARFLKVALYKIGVWPLVNRLRTGGRGYSISEGDGLAYSYSVYDSLDQLYEWADRVILVPTSSVQTRTWLNPLLTSSHVLVCAFRESRTGRAVAFESTAGTTSTGANL